MRNVMKPALRIGLSSTGIALVRTSGWLRTRTDLLADVQIHADDASMLADQLSAQLDRMLTDARCSRLPVSIVLAHDLVRVFIVTPPRNATCLQDCMATAAMRFQSLYGESPAAWQIEGDWRANRPFLACGMPQTLRTALLQVAATHKLNLVQLVPQFVAAWNRWNHALKPGAWFGVSDANRLTLAAMDATGICAIWSAALPAAERLQEFIHREALRLDLPAPQKLQLSGPYAAPWASKTIGTLACECLDARLLKTSPSFHMALALTGASA